jgi:hypothetical protein
MNISIISKEVARSRWAELFFFLAVATATASSLSSVVAAEAEVAHLQPTRRQSSNFYASNRALMRDDEQPSEEPGVARIINGTPTGGPLLYQVGLVTGPGELPICSGSLIAPRVVLTEAYCTDLPIDPPLNKVLINGYDLSSFDNGIPNGVESSKQAHMLFIQVTIQQLRKMILHCGFYHFLLLKMKTSSLKHSMRTPLYQQMVKNCLCLDGETQ